MNHYRWILGVAAVLFSATALGQTVRVASKNFTEQFVLAELYAQAFEAAGIKVERKINLGGTLIVHKALEEKQVDFYPEYTGTMLTAVLKMDVMTDRAAVYNNKERGHDALFREIASRHFSAALDRIVGPEWQHLREEEIEEQSPKPEADDMDLWFPR